MLIAFYYDFELCYVFSFYPVFKYFGFPSLFVVGAIEIFGHTSGVGGSLIFVINCEKE